MHFPLTSAVKQMLRAILGSIGVERYSRMGKHHLDLILQSYLPSRGVFLEAGALDGLYASNTYYLEKIRGWSGVLVEPVPQYYRQCAKLRRRSKVFNCALVPNSYNLPTVSLVIAYNASHISTQHKEGTHYQEQTGELIDVPARTLTSVLEEAGVLEIDFFSLDVEGYELQVLSGLDMGRFRPKLLLAECLTPGSKDEMQDFLATWNYEFVAQVTPRDLLWRPKELGAAAGV